MTEASGVHAIYCLPSTMYQEPVYCHFRCFVCCKSVNCEVLESMSSLLLDIVPNWKPLPQKLDGDMEYDEAKFRESLAPRTSVCSNFMAEPKHTLLWMTGQAPVPGPLGQPEFILKDRKSYENRQVVRQSLSFCIQSLGIQPQTLLYVSNMGRGADVFGVIPATSLEFSTHNEVVVIGAHCDSVSCPGADDNGSGSAAVLQIADAVVRMRIRTRATLIVFFDQEECGLVGSRYFARFLHKVEALSKIHSVHTVDMIGYNYKWQIALFNPHPDLIEMYTHTYAEQDPRLKVLPHTLAGISDFLSFPDFVCTGLGEPKLDSGTVSNPNHHKPTDTIETIDFDYLHANISLVLAVVSSLLAP
ncbi:M20/M25/M40 family metallo-hydrolase [Pelomyxa schiedti]|nr:M20/M25/M40 family metallo-hydrolase [Pelomyxa schiedti]